MNEFEQGMIGALLSGTYLAGQLPVLLAAGLWAKRFRPINGFEFATVGCTLYILLTTAITGGLGLIGCLSSGSLFVAAWCLGGVAWAIVDWLRIFDARWAEIQQKCRALDKKCWTRPRPLAARTTR